MTPEHFPQAPPVKPAELARFDPANRPRSVDIAFLMWIANAVLYVVGTVIGYDLANSDEVRSSVRDVLEATGQPATEAAVDRAVDQGRTMSLIFGVIFGVGYAVFPAMMRAGRNWARITLTVLAGLSAFSLLFAFVTPVPAISMVLGLIGVAIVGVATFLMYRPDANHYFREQ